MSQEQISALQAKLQVSQSRSFELISQLSAERDNAVQSANQKNQVLQQIVAILGLKAPSIDELIAEIAKNVPKKPAPKKTAKSK